MPDQFLRTELLLGPDAMRRLSGARVAVFGVGGVGGYVTEALARSGVGALDLIDSDTVSLTNLNRQILALHSTLGKYKVDVAEARIRDINPECAVCTYKTFYMPDTAGQFDFSQYDYIVDAIDTVTGKIELVVQANLAGTPIISSMGAGNKLDASAFEVADIYETSICPLARVMRRELKKRGIGHLKVVYSKEPPMVPAWNSPQSSFPYADRTDTDSPDADHAVTNHAGTDHPGSTDDRNGSSRRQVPGSTAFVPAVAGLIIAGEVVRDIASNHDFPRSQF